MTDMAQGRRKALRPEILKLIRKSYSSGIYQREIELALGISKSYCSEVVTALEEKGKVIRIRERGKGVRIYLTQFYPGTLPGQVRVGLLRASEYVPIMSLARRIFGGHGEKVTFRFYDSTIALLNDFRGKSIDLCMAPTSSSVLSAIMWRNTTVLTGIASGGSGIISRKEYANPHTLSTENSSMISLITRGRRNELNIAVEPFEDPWKGIGRFIDEGFMEIAIWEPFLSYLEGRTGMKPSGSYEDILDGFPCCSLSAHNEFIASHRDEVSDLVNACRKGDFNVSRPDEHLMFSIEAVAKATKTSPELVMKTLRNYNFHNIGISRAMLADLGITLSERQERESFFSGTLI